jgi:2-polyprenyl-3-methyl-5-hydroxy-6-metoxy-1,4-benzoquinol methylase
MSRLECGSRDERRRIGDLGQFLLWEQPVGREFDVKGFRKVFDELIVHGTFNEAQEYYPKWRARYQDILQRYSRRAGPAPLQVLDVGGGQLGLLAQALWGDQAAVVDIGGEHLDYLKSKGVETVRWNLIADDQPFRDRFNAVFFSEVIEHLPIPGHVVLERLRQAMRPGGLLICTTPNLYRLRNVVYMAIGKRIFDNFRMPTDRGLGHVLEYSLDHLRWQLEQAGFRDVRIDRRQYHHNPDKLVFRVMSWVGYPLFLIPRFRDYLVAEAVA